MKRLFKTVPIGADDQRLFKEATGAVPRSADAIPEGWELVEEACVPPLLLYPAVALYANVHGKILRPTDIDPFLESDSLQFIELEHNLWDRLGINEDTSPTELAKRIRQGWQTEKLDLLQAISLHSALLRRFNRNPYCFPIKPSGLPVWFLVCIYDESTRVDNERYPIYLIPITEDIAADPSKWQAFYHYVRRGGETKLLPSHRHLEALLRKGYFFHRYRHEGKSVYLLAKERFLLETDEDWKRYLSLITGLV